TDKQWKCCNVVGHVTAKSNPAIALAGCIAQLLEQAQKRWMRPAIQRRDPGIASIGGQEILCKVIASDAEEVALITQLVHHERAGWHFEHHAQWNVCAGEFVPKFLHGAELFDARDHGYKDPYSAMCRCTDNRAQLRLQQIAIVEQDTNA